MWCTLPTLHKNCLKVHTLGVLAISLDHLTEAAYQAVGASLNHQGHTELKPRNDWRERGRVSAEDP